MQPQLNDPNAATVLIVDDDPAIHRMMRRILRREASFSTSSAFNGQEAIDKLSSLVPDVVVLDIGMPGMDGFEVADKIRPHAHRHNIPVIFITGFSSVENHVKAMGMGVADFLSKTSEPEEILARLKFHVRQKRLGDERKKVTAGLQDAVKRKTDQLSIVVGKLNAVSIEVIWRLTAASEYRDMETGAHIQRMSHYAAAVAIRLGLKQKVVENILYSAPMHDVGKIGIPDSILLKPGKLDAHEWEVMKTHTRIGADILKGSTIGFLRMGEMIARTHHEKWDGSGYPEGLKGNKIPLAARIVAIADVFDALTSKRPYKAAFSIEKSVGIIKEERGHHFDPEVVDAFLSIQDEILAIKENNPED